MRPRTWLVGGATVIAFVLAVPAAWTGTTPITDACSDSVVRSPDELGDQSSEASVWPPGVKCKTHLSTGREFEGSYVTWYELILATLFVTGTYLLAATAARIIQPAAFMKGLGVALLAFLVASVAFFL